MHRPLDPNTGRPLPLEEDSVKSASSKGSQTAQIKEKSAAKKPEKEDKSQKETKDED